MLPPALVSSYNQYKQDTDSVAAWLASTAKAYGYASDLLHPHVGNSSARLKGKARTEAKKMAASSASTSASAKFQSSLPTYIIKVKDFVPLAEFLASKPQISVPLSFKATLDRVIAKRIAVSGELKKQGNAPDATSDTSHAYFIDILRQVRDILKPTMTPTSASTEARSQGLANHFASLEVHEPSDEFLNAPDVVRPGNAKGDQATYEAEPQTGLKELMAALVMIVNDLNRIRSYVKQIWLNYKNGHLDLTAAAIATNTAIDLGRNLVKEIEPSFKLHGGTWKVIHQFEQGMNVTKDYDTDGHDFSDETYMYDSYDIANKSYLFIFKVISVCVRDFVPNNIQIGMCVSYDASSDRESKSIFEKFAEDRALLMSFFVEQVTLIQGIELYPMEDEFLRGVREACQTKEVPFYLVFAAQIFLDIHHTIRNHTDRAFTTLKDNLKCFNRELDEHFEFHHNFKIDRWPASFDDKLRGIQLLINRILSDPVYKFKTRVLQELGRPLPDSIVPNWILIMSPVLSGLMLYHFRAEMHYVGITLANAAGSIMSAAHLYNAVRKENLMKIPWLNMDLVRALLGDSNFFVGEPPNNPEGYFSRLLLQRGGSAAIMANRRRRNITRVSRSGPRDIKDVAPVSWMFLNRYRRRIGQVDWTPEDIDQIISLGMRESEGTKMEGTVPAVDPEKIDAKKKMKRRPTKSAQLLPGKLIYTLALALHSEALEFSFPYTAVHRQCWSVFRAIKQRCEPMARQAFDSRCLARESELPDVVGYFLRAAAFGHDFRFLVEAADVLEGIVRDEGKSVLPTLGAYGFPVKTAGED